MRPNVAAGLFVVPDEGVPELWGVRGKLEADVIMTNLFIDAARRRSRWIRLVPLLRAPAITADPADQVVARDAVLMALRCLSPRQRACVVLHYYQDRPVAEVAAVLGVDRADDYRRPGTASASERDSG